MIAFIPFCLLAHSVYLKRYRRLHISKESLFFVLLSLYFYYYYQIPLRYLPFFLLSLLLGLWLVFVSQSYYLENYHQKQAILDLFLTFSSHYREHRSLYASLEAVERMVPASLKDLWEDFSKRLQEGQPLTASITVFSSHYLLLNMAEIIEQDLGFGDRHVQEHLLSLESDLLSLKFALKDYDLWLRRYLRQVFILLLLSLLIAALSYRMILSIESIQMTKEAYRLYRFFLQFNYFLYVFAHRICWEDLFLKEEKLEVR